MSLDDVQLPPGRGMPNGLIIPNSELIEHFSRSSGPGGQSVNTADSRVELRWDIAASTTLSELQRGRLLERLSSRITDGALVIVASEQRSQRQNRMAARARLSMLVQDAIAPPSAARRATRPSRAAKQRRLDEKKRRGAIKSARSRRQWD